MFVLYFSTVLMFHACAWYALHTKHVEVMYKLSKTVGCLDLLDSFERR